MSTTHVKWPFWAFLLAYAVIVLPRMAAPDSQLYASILTPALVDAVGSMIRLGALVVAWWYISMATKQFDRGNPTFASWTFLKWGVGLYVLGQLTLNVIGRVYDEPPYPSVADAFFLLGTIVLTAALLAFLRSYLSGGLMGSAQGPATVGLVAGFVLLIIDVFALRPLVDPSVPALETGVNLAYPILDSLLVVVALMLFRITVRFRGGSIWTVWGLLLSGFLCLAAGDIVYAYFTAFDMTHLDPIMDVMFTWSYLLLACGAVVNHRLTRAQ